MPQLHRGIGAPGPPNFTGFGHAASLTFFCHHEFIVPILLSVASDLLKNLSHRIPTAPAVNEARRMAIFEALMISVFPAKARLVMKIHMVNPIPPRIPGPTICDHRKPTGN